ncbi:MAG: hypothetical protein ABSC22_05635 [Roseiarcus sp.]|jgi:hypothetical protein
MTIRAADRHALAARIAELEDALAASRREIVKLSLENLGLAAQIPKVFPPLHWINVKKAANLTGYSAPLIYRWVRTGEVTWVKVKSRIAIDPASITRRRV